jgi:hypothetical protein
MAFNVDASFLILADQLGSLHFVNVETFEIIFSQDLNFLGDNLKCSSLCILPCGSSEQIIVFFENHEAVRFYNIQTRDIRIAIERQDMHRAGQLKSLIKVEEMELNEDYPTCHITNVFYHGNNEFWCFGKGENPLTRWSIGQDSTFCIDGLHESLLDGEVLKMDICFSKRLLVILSIHGALSIWDIDS